MKHTEEFYESEEATEELIQEYLASYNNRTQEEKDNLIHPVHEEDSDFDTDKYREQLSKLLEEVDYFRQCLSASITLNDRYLLSHIKRNKEAMQDLNKVANRLL